MTAAGRKLQMPAVIEAQLSVPSFAPILLHELLQLVQLLRCSWLPLVRACHSGLATLETRKSKGEVSLVLL